MKGNLDWSYRTRIIRSGVVGLAIQGAVAITNGGVAGMSTNWGTLCGDEG